jgi:hypothetical protein
VTAAVDRHGDGERSIIGVDDVHRHPYRASVRERFGRDSWGRCLAPPCGERGMRSAAEGEADGPLVLDSSAGRDEARCSSRHLSRAARAAGTIFERWARAARAGRRRRGRHEHHNRIPRGARAARHPRTRSRGGGLSDTMSAASDASDSVPDRNLSRLTVPRWWFPYRPMPGKSIATISLLYPRMIRSRVNATDRM